MKLRKMKLSVSASMCCQSLQAEMLLDIFSFFTCTPPCCWHNGAWISLRDDIMHYSLISETNQPSIWCSRVMSEAKNQGRWNWGWNLTGDVRKHIVPGGRGYICLHAPTCLGEKHNWLSYTVWA